MGSDVDTRPSGVRQRLLWLGAALLALQFALSLGYYLYDNTRTTAGAAQVYGDPTPRLGSHTPLYVGWVERFAGFREDAEVHVSVDGRSLDVTGPDRSDPMGLVMVPVEAEHVDVDIRIDVPAFPTRDAQVTLTASSEPPWLQTRARFTGNGSLRRPTLSPSDIEQPRVEVRDDESDCPWTFEVIPEAGIAARTVSNRLWLRLSERGAPVSGATITITPPPEGGPSPSRGQVETNTLGVDAVDITPLSREVWTFSYVCGDHGETQREVVVQPSWDGMALHGDQPTTVVGAPFAFTIEQQRSFGVWYLDVICDGGWVTSEVQETRAGTTTLRVEASAPAPSGGVGLCVVQATNNRLADAPPRAVRYTLLHSDETSPRDAVLRLYDAWRSHAAAEDTEDHGPQTRTALTTAPADDVSAYGVMLLSLLPPPFEPIDQLYDDRQAVADAFEGRRTKLRRTLGVVMGLDGLVVLCVVLLIVVPASLAQRRRFAALAEDDDEALPSASSVFDRHRDTMAIIALVLLIAAFAVGMVALLFYLR